MEGLFNKALSEGHTVVRFGESTRDGGFGVYSRRELVSRDYMFDLEEGAHDVCTCCGRAGASFFYVWHKSGRWNAECSTCFYREKK